MRQMGTWAVKIGLACLEINPTPKGAVRVAYHMEGAVPRGLPHGSCGQGHALPPGCGQPS